MTGRGPCRLSALLLIVINLEADESQDRKTIAVLLPLGAFKVEVL